MIFCGFFLPAVSIIQYVLNNMDWFTPMYRAIGIDRPPFSTPDSTNKCEKFLSRIIVKEPLAYLISPLLILMFAGFIVGALLVDYNTEEYELLATVKTTATWLTISCTILFTISNIQTIMAFITLVLALILAAVLTIPYLCKSLAYKCHCFHRERVV